MLSVWKRAVLYLTRKKARSLFLFFYMLCMACFLFVSVFFKEGADKELARLRKTFATGFVLETDSENEAYISQIELNGMMQKTYTGPMITDQTIEEILGIGGVTDYTLSNCDEYAWTDLKLKQGLFSNTEPHGIHTEEELEVDRQGILAYPCRNGDRHMNFSTGALEISQGRNLKEGDTFKAVISEGLAERNGLSVGSSFVIATKEGMYRPSKTPGRNWGKPMELEVAGIFHMNIFQQESPYTSEDGYLENNIYVDLGTYARLQENIYGNWDEITDSGYSEVTFFVEDPENLDSVMEEVKKRADTDGMLIYADNTSYQASAKPYSQIRTFAAALFWICVLGSSAILFLLMKMWVQGRRREVGILLSIGMKKGKIIGQMLLECFILSALAVSLSVLLSGTLAGVSSRAVEKMTDKGEQKEPYRLTMESKLYPVVELNAAEKAKLPDEVTFGMLLLLVCFVNGISVGSTFLASIQVLEIEPGNLLQSM